MLRMKNKKGLGFVFIIALILAFLALAILASWLGLTAIKRLIDEIGPTYLLITIVVALAFVFKDFLETVLFTAWGWLVSVVSMFKM